MSFVRNVMGEHDSTPIKDRRPLVTFRSIWRIIKNETSKMVGLLLSSFLSTFILNFLLYFALKYSFNIIYSFVFLKFSRGRRGNENKNSEGKGKLSPQNAPLNFLLLISIL